MVEDQVVDIIDPINPKYVIEPPVGSDGLPKNQQDLIAEEIAQETK